MSAARVAFAVFVAGLAAAPLRSQSSPPAAAPDDLATRAFVEATVSKAEPYVGESIELDLRIGLDADLLANHLVPLFARAFDLPVQVEWSAARAIDGWTLREAADGPAAGATFALGEAVARARPGAEIVRTGRTFKTFEFVRRMTPTRAGASEIAAPSLRFAYASRIDDDLIRGRVGADRTIVQVAGAPLSLHVRPLPDEGRPAEFTGAVGRRTLAVAATPTSLAAGESVRLTLTIGGEGDPAAFGAPDLSHLPGFVLRGVLDDAGGDARRLVYDLAPLDAKVRAIPPLAFAFFSPDPPVGYVTVRSDPIALDVRPRASGGDSEMRAVGEAGEKRKSTTLLALVAAGVAILAAFLVVIRRSARRGDAPADSTAARAGAAAVALRARVAEPGADVAAAFTDYLAARLGVASAAVVAPDLAARLERRGVSRELATRVAAQLAASLASRYSGGADPSESASAPRSASSAELVRLFERLEAIDFAPPPAR